MGSVSLVNGHIDGENLGIDGLYTMCRNLQLTTKRSEKERIIEYNKDYEDFKKLLLFLFDNSVTTGLDIKKINKQIMVDGTTTLVPPDTFKNLLEYVKCNNTGTNIDIINVRNYILLKSGDIRNERGTVYYTYNNVSGSYVKHILDNDIIDDCKENYTDYVPNNKTVFTSKFLKK